VLDTLAVLCLDAGNAELTALAKYWAQWLASARGIHLAIVDKATASNRKTISLNIISEPDSLNHEGYRVSIESEQETLQAATNAGLFYGLQTLKQPPKSNAVR